MHRILVSLVASPLGAALVDSVPKCLYDTAVTDGA